MNIVQINKFIEKIAGCTELVHSFYTDSVYECWNGSGDVDYGSFVFCIKKTRMRERTMIYDAIVYYGDRLLDDKSNRDAIWSDATNVIQSIIGAVNNVEGEISIGYPYEINLFEQKFADELAGAYANISIEVEGVGECADLLYGYENVGGDIKLESITRTFTVNGIYDIVAGEDYDAISDVKVIVNIPLQEKSIELTHNGHYNVSPDEGYEGITEVDIDVNIPLQEKSVLYNEAGIYEVVPDDDYKALTKVNVEVSLEGKQSVPNGFRFTGGDMALVEWDKYDWSMVYDTSYFFQNCTFSDDEWGKRFKSGFNGEMWSGKNMFYNCTSLISIPQLDTSKVIDMSYMFSRCIGLTSIPQLDTSNVTNMSYMFTQCTGLTSIPQLDTSNVTIMAGMFYNCNSLTSIPQLDTSNVTNMGEMFGGCTSLTSIPLLDCNSVSYTTGPFGWQSLSNITDLGGFKDLKVSWSSNFLNAVPNVTVESLMNVINNLYDLTANGLEGKDLKFGSTNLNKLTDEQKAVATAKGWTLMT